jgi:hypothetical protein
MSIQFYYGIQIPDEVEVDSDEINEQWDKKYGPKFDLIHPGFEDAEALEVFSIAANKHNFAYSTWQETLEFVTIQYLGDYEYVHVPSLQMDKGLWVDLSLLNLESNKDANLWLARFCEESFLPYKKPSWYALEFFE